MSLTLINSPGLLILLGSLQIQLDEAATRLASHEAAVRASHQRNQLASLRAQLNALQQAPPSGPAQAPTSAADDKGTALRGQFVKSLVDLPVDRTLCENILQQVSLAFMADGKGLCQACQSKHIQKQHNSDLQDFLCIFSTIPC